MDILLSVKEKPYITNSMEAGTVVIALIQMAAGPDTGGNLKKAQERVESAAAAGAQIICLPELYRSPYFPQHIGADIAGYTETLPGESTGVFIGLAQKHKVVLIVPILQRTPEGRIYNSVVVIDADGSVSAPYHKVHIPQDPGFFEKNYFYPGDAYRVYSTRYGRIAVLICYDQWFPEAARCVALDGAEIIFYPTAIGHPNADIPAEGDWRDAWELIQRSHAIANSVHVAAVNRVGQEGAIRFFGGSFICDAFGKILGRLDGEEGILTATVDLSMNAAVSDSWGFIRNRRPETYGRICTPFPGENGAFPVLRPGDTPRNRGFHMPAEWEPHAAVWISWPGNKDTFPQLPLVEKAYYEFVREIHTSERVEIFVPSAIVHRQVRARLREMGVDLARITLHTSEYVDVWIRDYGPTFVVNRPQKKLALVRWNFNAWGGKYERQILDGKIPFMMNRRFSLPMFEPEIILEGGSIDVNGMGTVLTTESCLLNPNRNPRLSADEIEEKLKSYLGIEKIIWLKDGLEGDDTDGHIDDIARFVGPSTIVCACETDPGDANYTSLQENFEILSRSTDQEGRPFTIVKLPMPGKIADADGRYPASYTNFYIGNTKVIVPIFDDPADQEALSILQGLFPGRKVVGINARAMVEGYGTFHCGTQQQPDV